MTLQTLMLVASAVGLEIDKNPADAGYPANPSD